MPDYTKEDIHQLYTDGVINSKQRQVLIEDLIIQANQEEGLLRKFLGKASQEVVNGWANLRAVGGKKEGMVEIATANVQGVIGALQIITSIPNAFGQTLSEPFYDWLVKRGVNRNVAAFAAGVVEVSASTKAASIMGKPIKAGISTLTESNKAQRLAIDENIRKGLMQWMDETLGKDTWAKVADKLEAEQVKQVVRSEQDRIIEQANVQLKNITNTQKLLDKASETVRGKGSEATPTSETLDAAYQTLVGKKSVEAVVSEAKRNSKIRGAATGLNKMTDEMAAVRGGAPTAVEEVGAIGRARAAFEEGAQRYESGKIKLDELQRLAKEAKTTLADVQMLESGVAKTPLEVAQISQPVRQSGEFFIKQVDDAEAALANGDYAPFWRAMAEFNFQVRAHWPYMAPRQVAGQTLKTYDEPVLSATRYLQQVPGLSSWMGKLKMNTAEEVEANAALILREMQKIKAPSQLANFGRKVAEEMAEKGDEVLETPTFRDYAEFFFVNSIMSGTDTIGRNFSGNIVGAPWHYADKVTSVVAARVMNPFLSAKNHVEQGYLSEANTFISSWAKGLWDGTRYALKGQWDDLYGMVPNQKALEELITNRYDLFKKYTTTGTSNPFSGTAGKVIGTPVGIAQKADEVSRIVFYRAAALERLKHDWIATDSKIPFGQYAEDGLANLPPSIHEYAMRIAQEFTWSDKLSGLGTAVSSFMRQVPGSKFVQPFIRTPDRLIAQTLNRSPILNTMSKRLYDEINSGDPTKKAEAIGRVLWTNIVGGGLFMALGSKAPDGMNWVTGGGPTDRYLAARLRNDKIHLPYTIWTPAGRVPYHYLQPAAGTLGLVADAREIWDELRDADAETYWSGIVLAIQRNILDATYTKQIADFAKIWDDPTDEGPGWRRFAANAIKGFVEPSIARQIMREIDPTVKEVHSFYDELTRDIPGWGVPAKRDMLTGQPILIPPRLLSDVPGVGWVLPTSPMQPKTDAFANKIRELGLKLPEFYRAFGGPAPSQNPLAYQGALGEAEEAMAGIPIPEPLRQKGVEYMTSAEMFGQTLTDEANALVEDPEFNKLAPIEQAENIRAIYNARMGAARKRIISESPELLEGIQLKMQKRAEVRMPVEERDAFVRTLEPPAEPEITAFPGGEQ